MEDGSFILRRLKFSNDEAKGVFQKYEEIWGERERGKGALLRWKSLGERRAKRPIHVLIRKQESLFTLGMSDVNNVSATVYVGEWYIINFI